MAHCKARGGEDEGSEVFFHGWVIFSYRTPCGDSSLLKILIGVVGRVFGRAFRIPLA